MPVPNAVLFLVASLIWGSTWLAITFQLGTVSPQVSVAYRFALASLMLAAYCGITGKSLKVAPRGHLLLAAFGATLFGLNYIGIYWAEQYVTSGLVAVVFSLIVFTNTIGARLVYDDALTARVLFAAALGVTGVALLFLPEIDAARRGGAAALGVLLAVASTLIASVGNLLAARTKHKGMSVLAATTWGMAYGALTAAIMAASTGVAWTFEASPAYVLSLLYLSLFGSVVAFLAYLTLLNRVGAGPAAFVAVATPVLALVLSTLFEGYRWTWVSALGVVLAVAGNWLALKTKPARD